VAAAKSVLNEFTEKSVIDLISRYNDEPEGTQLDFKSSHLLDPRQKPGAVLGEIVSAFANALGGIVIVGVTEKARGSKKLYQLDEGVDGDLPARERLGRIIAANVAPAIVTEIEPIKKANGKFMFAILVPEGDPGKVYQSVPQHIFYRRHGEQSLPMAEYEIRERYQRALGPDLRVLANVAGDAQLPLKGWAQNPELTVPFTLRVQVVNRNPPAIKHALFQLYFDDRLHVWSEEHRGFLHTEMVPFSSEPKLVKAVEIPVERAS
jgi:schlafen family protein